MQHYIVVIALLLALSAIDYTTAACRQTTGTPSNFSRIIFYTSMPTTTTFYSSLTNVFNGGLTAADQLCTATAASMNPTSANSGGLIYKALLSDENTDAISRLPPVDYTNLYGGCMANSPYELLSMSSTQIASVITDNNNKSIITYVNIHTGTQYNGTRAVGDTCQSWTMQTSAHTQRVGQLNRLTNNVVSSWVDYVDLDCGANNNMAVICVQQLTNELIRELNNGTCAGCNDSVIIQTIVYNNTGGPNATNTILQQPTVAPKKSTAATASLTTLIATTIVSSVLLAAVCNVGASNNNGDVMASRHQSQQRRRQAVQCKVEQRSAMISSGEMDQCSQMMVASRLM